MNRRGLVTAFTLSLLLVGCTTVFKPWNMAQIQEGMGRQQVVSLLGAPDYTTLQGGTEQLHYIYREDFTPPLANDPIYASNTDRAFHDLNSGKVFEEAHYVITLVEGKVLNHRKL